jgi:hypothetical protein
MALEGVNLGLNQPRNGQLAAKQFPAVVGPPPAHLAQRERPSGRTFRNVSFIAPHRKSVDFFFTV